MEQQNSSIKSIICNGKDKGDDMGDYWISIIETIHKAR